MRKQSLRPLPKLKHKAEHIFHKYIVLRDRGICFTCGKVGNQTGHFKHNKLDFDEDNLHCQCVYCNMYQSGNLGIYATKLIKEHGIDWMDEFILRSNQLKKYRRDELEEIIKTYQNKVMELMSIHSLPF